MSWRIAKDRENGDYTNLELTQLEWEVLIDDDKSFTWFEDSLNWRE